MKLNKGNSQTEFVCMCCMEHRWRQTPRRGWICPYRVKDIYCPVVEHVFLREQHNEFSWTHMERDLEKNMDLNKVRMEREAAGEKTVHQMSLLASHFESVQQGSKTVEMRLDDTKRRWIRAGDLIEFSCADDADRKLVVEVINKMVFLDFEELVEHYDAKSLDLRDIPLMKSASTCVIYMARKSLRLAMSLQSNLLSMKNKNSDKKTGRQKYGI